MAAVLSLVLLGDVINSQDKFLLAFAVRGFHYYVVLVTARQRNSVVVFIPVQVIWAATLVAINQTR